MNNYLKTFDTSKCSGCSACADICPVSCIQMLPNDEGFLYPVVNVDNCVNCDMCAKTCPIQHTVQNNEHVSCYAMINNDIDVLAKSSSGGVFYELAKKIIKNNGVVFGAELTDEHVLCHKSVESMNQLDKLLGSKYIQCDTSGVLSEVKRHLQQGRTVMFAGTPCQVAGLKLFLQKEYDNLITVDLLCHGVPSSKMFNAYIKYLEHKHKGTLTDIIFRSKKKNGWSITLSYDIKKKNKINTYSVPAGLSPYFFAFLRGKILRESCYHCSYSSPNRVGDITLADFWGIHKVDATLDTSMGCSSVVVNTEKGKKLIDSIFDSFVSKEVTFEQASVQNINFFKPAKRPNERNSIYGELDERGFDFIAKKYLVNPRRWRIRIKNLICNVKKRL